MAKATVVRAAPRPPVEKVTLELSHEEAQALMNVVGAVTGSAQLYVGNPIDATTPIYHALYEVDYRCVHVFRKLVPEPLGDT